MPVDNCNHQLECGLVAGDSVQASQPRQYGAGAIAHPHAVEGTQPPNDLRDLVADGLRAAQAALVLGNFDHSVQSNQGPAEHTVFRTQRFDPFLNVLAQVAPKAACHLECPGIAAGQVVLQQPFRPGVTGINRCRRVPGTVRRDAADFPGVIAAPYKIDINLMLCRYTGTEPGGRTIAAPVLCGRLRSEVVLVVEPDRMVAEPLTGVNGCIAGVRVVAIAEHTRNPATLDGRGHVGLKVAIAQRQPLHDIFHSHHLALLKPGERQGHIRRRFPLVIRLVHVHGRSIRRQHDDGRLMPARHALAQGRQLGIARPHVECHVTAGRRQAFGMIRTGLMQDSHGGPAIAPQTKVRVDHFAVDHQIGRVAGGVFPQAVHIRDSPDRLVKIDPYVLRHLAQARKGTLPGARLTDDMRNLPTG